MCGAPPPMRAGPDILLGAGAEVCGAGAGLVRAGAGAGAADRDAGAGAGATAGAGWLEAFPTDLPSRPPRSGRTSCVFPAGGLVVTTARDGCDDSTSGAGVFGCVGATAACPRVPRSGTTEVAAVPVLGACDSASFPCRPERSGLAFRLVTPEPGIGLPVIVSVVIVLPGRVAGGRPTTTVVGIVPPPWVPPVIGGGLGRCQLLGGLTTTGTAFH
jgi:hypothetical protein